MWLHRRRWLIHKYIIKSNILGFEISLSSVNVEKFWELLLSHEAVKPAGLGARDVLRIEAALCLHGADMTE